MLSDAEIEAILISLRVAGVAVAWILLPGIAVAWLMARHEFRGKALLDGLLHLPLVLPPVVVGYLLLVSLGSRGLLGTWLNEWWGVRLPFTWQGAAVAGGVMAFPLLVRALRLSLEAVDPRLEAAASTLGAGRWRVFATITLPLTLPGLLTGSVLAFARALSEFGATITFASNIPGETRTLPLALYSLIQTPGGEAAAARLCALSVVIAMISLVASEWLARRARARLQGRDA
ncbi:molybdate ABC transporter permease subunit [Halomonas elongata]|uniref:Molybdenum transport system permease n=2 Tax=Halomonas elongata TaxID=2746 RepID=E1VAA0_HALED|nr:molybdate ABC transporter permease subunit [Halomonas elongata]OBX37094.1 molybdenum transport system permease protein ModB [Halomonas elongata]RAW06034.1 molybdate ABC transporter permease subunit [Halomonas elongata]WBF19190.1 molybdate ABC transporter permease subunit [Halomonas elongata]WPU48050.1 molybdate ABC transporter permease subunit [Halomonas elongata DSM 2581]WVI72691.1 molybdate ABC transporter permease subunit [Halomonas elongata]